MEQAQDKLAAALVVAQRTARAVARDAQNQHHKYRYASAEAIIDEARGALSGAGLALLTDSWTFEPAPAASEHGIGRVVCVYSLIHESGQSRALSMSTPVLPGNGRPADKAEFASITANLKYALRGLLLLPRDDEAAEIDARADGPRGNGNGAPAAQPASALPPGTKELEAAFVAEIEAAAHVGQLPPIAKRVDGHVWPEPAKERIKAAYAARKAKLLEAGSNEPDATQLADEYIAQFAREATLESLLAVQQHIRTMTWEPAEIERIRSAYNARKAEIQAAQKNGANAAAAAAQGAAA